MTDRHDSPDKEQRHFEWIWAHEIHINPAVNPRPVNYNRVKAIANKFDADGFGLLTVMPTTLPDKKGYDLIDGQHRFLAAVALWGLNQQLYSEICFVTVEEANGIFAILNSAVRASAIVRYLAALRNGQPFETGLNRVLASHGLRVAQGSGQDRIQCVQALAAVYLGSVDHLGVAHRANYDKTYPVELSQTLHVIKTAWGDHSAVFKGDIVMGLGAVIRKYGAIMDLDSLANRLAQYPAGCNGILAAGRSAVASNGGSMSINIARLIVNLYNKGRRNRVPDWGSK